MNNKYIVDNTNKKKKLNFSNTNIVNGPHCIYTFSKKYLTREIIKMKPELMEIMFNKIGPSNYDGVTINNEHNTFCYKGIRYYDNKYISVKKYPKFMFKYNCDNDVSYNKINISFYVTSSEQIYIKGYIWNCLNNNWIPIIDEEINRDELKIIRDVNMPNCEYINNCGILYLYLLTQH